MTPGDSKRGIRSTNEQSPLLGPQAPPNDDIDGAPSTPEGETTTIIWMVLAAVFVVGLIVVFTLPVPDWRDPFPSPESILDSAPVIDGHIGQFNPPHVLPSAPQLIACLPSQSDLPELVRVYYANNISAFNLNQPMLGHVDIPRLRKGKVGGFFWYAHPFPTRVVLTPSRSVYVACPKDPGPDFVNPAWPVRYRTIQSLGRGEILIIFEQVTLWSKLTSLTCSSSSIRRYTGSPNFVPNRLK